MSNYNWEAIRKSYNSGGFSLRALAEKFGVKSPSAISKKAAKEGWKRPEGNGKQETGKGNDISTFTPISTEKRKVGRPPKFTEDIAQEICDRLSVGESLIAISRDDHIPDRVTVYKWLGDAVKRDADEKMVEFLNKYKRSRELQADSFFDEAIDIADETAQDTTTKKDRYGNDHEVINHEAIQRSKLRVETRFKIAAISKPSKYSEKRLMEITGKDGEPIKTEITTDMTPKEAAQVYADSLKED